MTNTNAGLLTAIVLQCCECGEPSKVSFGRQERWTVGSDNMPRKTIVDQTFDCNHIAVLWDAIPSAYL